MPANPLTKTIKGFSSQKPELAGLVAGCHQTICLEISTQSLPLLEHCNTPGTCRLSHFHRIMELNWRKFWEIFCIQLLWRRAGSLWSVCPGEKEEEVVTAHGGSVARCNSSQYHLPPLMICCPGLALAFFLLPLVSTTPYSYIQVNCEGPTPNINHQKE